MEAARGAVGLALELTARVEGGHDDLERRLARIFGVRVDRDTAAVVEDGQAVPGLERDLDTAGVAGDRLVHRIVDDLGGEVVERAGVGAADVHARTAADRLQAFEDLDGGSVVAFGRGGSGRGSEQVGHLRFSYKALIQAVPRNEPWFIHSLAMPTVTLRPAVTIGERSLKVDHAGENGAVSIYRAQRWVARWTAPRMVPEIDEFLSHEQRHRALFASELARRGVRRCRSFHLCGLGGLVLGFVTGLLGSRAISITTESVESVVLSHLERQLEWLSEVDPIAADVIAQIIADEREHHDRSAERIAEARPLDRVLAPLVRGSTEAVIWLGMRGRLHAKQP